VQVSAISLPSQPPQALSTPSANRSAIDSPSAFSVAALRFSISGKFLAQFTPSPAPVEIAEGLKPHITAAVEHVAQPGKQSGQTQLEGRTTRHVTAGSEGQPRRASWVQGMNAGRGTLQPTDAELDVLAEVNRRANALAGDGAHAGIVAAIVKEGIVLCYGENEVNMAHDATRHAEIVAIGRAGAALGSPDLAGASLISSLQPCEMCLAAMRFARIDRLIFSARKEDVGPKYFVFGSFDIEAFRAASDGAFGYAAGLMLEDVRHLYATEQE
jgi:tRNA(adenine34) deaminase